MRNGLLASSIMAALLGITPTAFADTTSCVGTLSGGPYPNIVVPVGVTCTLNSVTVNGNVLALENSKLFIFNSTVNGNVEAEDGEMLQIAYGSHIYGNVMVIGGEVDDNAPATFDTAICGSTVHGNVSVMDSGGDVIFGSFPSINCLAPHITGNLHVEGISARVVLRDLMVGKNMTVQNNIGTVDNRVENNSVGKNLTCEGNALPFSGGPNIAAKTIGQCS